MHKKLVAALTIAIFLLSTLAVVTPAKAAFTLGNLTGTYRYHANDYFPVTGPIGYVFPGGGQDWYTGAWGPGGGVVGPHTTPFSSPGYQTPWPGGNPIGAPSSSWYQLEGHTYTPFGAVLTGSTGDLIFAINASAAWKNRGIFGYDRWYILIPPEFTMPSKAQISTTIRNDYARISTFKLGYDDAFAPGWNVVYVWANGICYQNCATTTPDIHGFINFTKAQDNWYYVRINGVRAPNIAGKYFFKMWLHGDEAESHFLPSTWVNASNWPVMLVKGEVDPAIITGTIRYGPYNASLAGQPVQEAGKVWANMVTKLDPYTGASIADCTATPAPAGCTDAVGYFNATYNGPLGVFGSGGHYEVEGVAPGIYNLYASAMGYPQSIIASNVQVLKGQSLHMDGYLNPGIVIHGTVDSKHQFGTEPFPRTDYIKIELYNQPTGGHWPTTNPKSWSPLPCVANGLHTYNDPTNLAIPYRTSPEDTGFATGCQVSAGQLQYLIDAPWHENLVNDLHSGIVAGSSPIFDWQGVGPAQKWQVISGTTRFTYQFGVKGEYGAPSGFDGHVPQVNATWVDGLQPGRYYVRAWLTQYVQTTLDGSTFNEVGFNVPANEWAGDVSVPLDLRLGDVVNKTIHFHDTPGTFTAGGIYTGATYVDAQLTDSAGNVWANNQTVWGAPDGFSGHAPDGRAAVCDYVHGCDAFKEGGWQVRHGISYVVLMGFNNRTDGRDYGIPAGTYGVNEYILGYVQQTVPQVSVSLSGTYLNFSDNVYRGLGFNLTVYSIDWERPRVDRNWLYPYFGAACAGEDACGGPANAAIDILILDSKGNVADSITNSAFQDNTINHLELNGFQSAPTLGLCSDGVFQLPASENTCGVYFGAESASHGGEGGYLSNTAGYFIISDDPSFAGGMGLFTAFESGTYSFRGWTQGYIQNKDFTVSGLKGDVADIKINLLVGARINLTIPFKKEGLLTPTAMNMSARVRIFDDSGMLVGTWMSDQGVSVTASYNGTAGLACSPTCGPTYTAVGHDGSDLYPWQWNGYNFVPGGVSALKVSIDGKGSGYGYYEGDAWRDPVYGSLESDVQWPTYQNSGILGAPDYTGGYTAEVDFVPWYRNNTVGMLDNSVFYPPVNGLLMGESYHFIPGSDYAANGGFGYVGTKRAANHLGPYGQQGQWLLPNAYLGGETSGIFEVDLRGYVAGNLNGFTWSNEFRTLSWSVPGTNFNVKFASSDGTHTYWTTAQDGVYEGFLPDGTYAVTVSAPGMTTITGSLAVSAGQAVGGFNFNMEQSGIPIPEFSGIAIVAFSALAASLYLLRRRRR